MGAYFLLSTGSGKPFPVPAYSVLRVIDGDTFVTTEKQVIRVGSTEAPELERCGGQEAKKSLEKLVMGKPIYLKINYRDPYQRLVSLVYTKDAFVNEEMLANGYSYYYRTSPGEIGQHPNNTHQPDGWIRLKPLLFWEWRRVSSERWHVILGLR